MHDDVEQLVERAKRGDRAAFSMLFRKHASMVTALVYRMLGRSPDLEDVVQEVFMQVHRSLGDFRGQAKFSTWLHRVAVNVVLMHRRRAKSRPVLDAEDAAAEPPDSTWAPDKDLARQQRVDAFHRLLDQLSDKKREVFVLHEIEGLSPTEIATLTRCPVLTVRTRLFYARKELGELMRAEPALAALIGDLQFGRASSRAKGESIAPPTHSTVAPLDSIAPPPDTLRALETMGPLDSVRMPFDSLPASTDSVRIPLDSLAPPAASTDVPGLGGDTFAPPSSFAHDRGRSRR